MSRRTGARRLAKAPLVLVDWVDAASPTGLSSWFALDDISSDEHEVAHVRSVGWVLHESPTSLTLISTHHGVDYDARRQDDRAPRTGDRGSGILSIPKVAIVRRRKLPDP